MNAHTPPPSDPDDALSRRFLERQLEMLERLAEVGLDIAVAVGRQVAATAEAPAETPDDSGRRTAVLSTAAMAYARAARAVRMTLALQSRLIQTGAGAQAGSGGGETITFAWATEPSPSDAARRRVERRVRRAAEAASLDREAVERLALEAAERLEDEDYGDLTARPLEEIVALICKDLGIEPPAPASPVAEATAGGGPPAERSEERVVEGAGSGSHAPAFPPGNSS